ncbi:MAG TPA: hypothetical protein VGU63_16520 [Candidatus Acidoferrales bacterium]|nr:hypothetical protein [Candidatus Acidoferrales bacterium]
MKDHPIFRFIWALGNLLLIVSTLCLLSALFWEYSTRQYLKGFSDAVVPANALPGEKIQAIIDWMNFGPARREGSVTGELALRDPKETLNYESLLRVCGSATNAFINLGVTSGLEVRRLLLLDARGSTAHVDAEVLLDGRWVVVDPAFRIILRGSDGKLLTVKQLKNPRTFEFATSGLKNYLPQYSFGRTAHIHFGRIGFLGPLVKKIVTTIFPRADASPLVTLLVERESLAACVAAAILFLFSCVLRLALGWIAEARLGIKRLHLTERLRRSGVAFLKQPS